MIEGTSADYPLIYRFHSHTDAALWACQMRAEGHRAYLLDETTSWLWGPLAVGGIRVAVYPRGEEEDTDEFDEPPPRLHELPMGCTVVTLAFLAFGLLSQVVILMQMLVSMAIYIGLLVVVGLLMMPLMILMVRGIRSRHHLCKSLLWLVVMVLIFVIFWIY